MENTHSTVSVVVDRVVLSGKRQEFEGYLKNIIKASSEFSGYLGTEVISPQGDNRYILIFRYASQEELDDWSSSEARDFWIKKIDQVIEEPSKLTTLTGLETWFCLAAPDKFVPPPKYKMVMVTYLAIAPTVTVFNLLFAPYFSSIPTHLVIFVTAPFIVTFVTYVAMPMLTRLFKHYLYPKQKNSE